MESHLGSVVSTVLAVLHHTPRCREMLLAAAPHCAALVSVAQVFKAMDGEVDDAGRQGSLAIQHAVAKFIEEHNPFPHDGRADAYEAFALYLDLLNSLYEKSCTDLVAKFGKPFDCFEIKINNFLACQTCGHYSEMTESTISVPISANFETIYNGIANFKAVEVIDGYHCSGCKGSTTIDKGTKLHSSSDTLIIQIKRAEFSYETFQIVKNSKKVHFDLTLSSEQLGLQEHAHFELVSVLVHLGNFQTGQNHFYVRGPIGAPANSPQEVVGDITPVQAWESTPASSPEFADLHRGWTKMSDFKLTPATMEDLARTIGPGALNPLAYLLCYKKTTPAAPLA